MTTLTIKVGVMPGKIQEVAVEQGTSVKEVLELVELSATGYEIRVNGATSNESATLTEDGTVLLVKQIKGNGNFKVGVMPGRISEFAVNDGTTVSEILGLAGLNATGYEIRVNGATATQDTVLTGDGTVLLVKQIKGNASLTFKVGVMPGRIQEFVAKNGISVKELLELAELNPSGYEIRVNGVTSNTDTILSENGTVLLVKQIKGNK